LTDRGIVTAKYLTDHTTPDVAHSGATVLDSHQLPYAITQKRRYVLTIPARQSTI